MFIFWIKLSKLAHSMMLFLGYCPRGGFCVICVIKVKRDVASHYEIARCSRWMTVFRELLTVNNFRGVQLLIVVASKDQTVLLMLEVLQSLFIDILYRFIRSTRVRFRVSVRYCKLNKPILRIHNKRPTSVSFYSIYGVHCF